MGLQSSCISSKRNEPTNLVILTFQLGRYNTKKREIRCIACYMVVSAKEKYKSKRGWEMLGREADNSTWKSLGRLLGTWYLMAKKDI
jgi:hypothetical protein